MHSIHELSLALTGLYERYDEWEWDYAAALTKAVYGKPINDFTNSDWAEMLEKGLAAEKTVFAWKQKDAAKEFAPQMQISYGIDSGKTAQTDEFAAIHGNPENHAFIQRLDAELRQKIKEIDLVKNRLK